MTQYTLKHNRLYLVIRTDINRIIQTLLSFFINVHINGKTESLKRLSVFLLYYYIFNSVNNKTANLIITTTVITDALHVP